jgi:elongation factor G
MHPVDSNDISFKVAGKMAFREAFRAADPQLLEPVWTLEVLCPDELTGHVMGDLQTRRAMIEGIETDGHFQRITARVPLAETEGYPSALRSLTQGRARLRMNFSGYAPVPYELQQRLMDAYHKVSDLVEA